MGARDYFDDQTLQTDAAREYAFTRADFERVRKLIHVRAGISLNESKQNMVYSRLSRRLRTLGIDSFAAYLDRLESDPTFDSREAQRRATPDDPWSHRYVNNVTAPGFAAYCLERWTKSADIVYRANPAWHRPPAIRRIVVRS